MAAYRAGLADIIKPTPKHGDGAIGSLVLSFYQSSAFNNLAPSSQKRYGLCSRSLPPKMVTDLCAICHAGSRSASSRISARRLQAWRIYRLPSCDGYSPTPSRKSLGAIIRSQVSSLISLVRSYLDGSGDNRVSRDVAIGTRERLAFDLLLYTGQRVGDVAGMRHADIRDGAIHIVTEKTEADLSLPSIPTCWHLSKLVHPTARY